MRISRARLYQVGEVGEISCLSPFEEALRQIAGKSRRSTATDVPVFKEQLGIEDTVMIK